jgi:archaellum biogenesis ATPase FlaH
MEYRELVKVIVGRLFAPYNDEDQDLILQNIKEKDFKFRFYREIFKFGSDKYLKRGSIPNIDELAVNPKIALMVANSSDSIRKQFGKKGRYKLKEIKEIINYSNKEEEAVQNSMMFIDEVDSLIRKKIYPPKQHDLSIIHYIEKLKNAKKLDDVEDMLKEALGNAKKIKEEGEDYNPNEIFKDGLDFILPEDKIDTKSAGDIFREIQEEERNGVRTPTYIPSIDREYRLGGLKRGEVGTVGANTGVGKTFFGLVMFYNQIINGHDVYYMTLEESKKELMQRIYTIHANLVPEYRKLNIKSEEWEGGGLRFSDRPDILEKIADDLDQYDFAGHIVEVINDTSYKNIKQRLISLSLGKKNAELIYIDYLQMISTDAFNGLASSYKKAVEDIISFARTTKTSIIGLAQLNDPEKKKPAKGDIRWSKSFANNSHFVYLLYREEYGLTQEEIEEQGLQNNKKMELLIEKNRGAGKAYGTVPLFFDQEYGYIQEYTSLHENKALNEELENLKDYTKATEDLEENGVQTKTIKLEDLSMEF